MPFLSTAVIKANISQQMWAEAVAEAFAQCGSTQRWQSARSPSARRRGNNDMPPDLSGDRPLPMFLCDRLGSAVSDGAQGLWVAGFNLIAQWRALAVSHRRIAGTRSVASLVQRHHLDGRKPGVPQLGGDLLDIMTPVRRSGEKSGRVAWENRAGGVGYQASEVIVLNAIPHIEQKTTAGFEDAKRFPIPGDSVRKNITPNWQQTVSKLPS